MKRYGAVLVIAGVVVAIIAGIALLRSRGSNEQAPQLVGQQVPSPAQTTAVTIEEFGDYQCAPCAQLHPTLKEIKQQLGPNLNFVFRNLPLSNIHKNALAAAQAAEAARMQNRFWEMHDVLYQSQDLWKDDKQPRTKFLKFAGDIGLDLARFERDMDNEQVRFRIEADRDAALRLGIESTPTVLINGRKLRPEATNAEGIRRGIEVMGSGRQPSPTASSPSAP